MEKNDVLGIIGTIAILVYAVIMFTNWNFTPSASPAPEFKAVQEQIRSERMVGGGF